MTPPIVARATAFKERNAIRAGEETFTYKALLDASACVAAHLLGGSEDLNEARVCFHIPPGFAHVAVQWGILRAGGIAVPLAMSHPLPELEYTVRDADPTVIVAAAAG